jgi:hypothetical protein
VNVSPEPLSEDELTNFATVQPTQDEWDANRNGLLEQDEYP